MGEGVKPTLTAVSVPDRAERWEALGFELVTGAVALPGARVLLQAPRMSVAIDGVTELPEGLALDEARPIAPAYSPHPDGPGPHPNGATGIDHVVALTPDFDATAAALEKVGLPLRRVRDAGGFRQGFRRLGGPILELVEARRAPAPAWWGLTLVAHDLGALPQNLVSPAKPAVQPGRFIATARSPGTPLAFITPEP